MGNFSQTVSRVHYKDEKQEWVDIWTHDQLTLVAEPVPLGRPHLVTYTESYITEHACSCTLITLFLVSNQHHRSTRRTPFYTIFAQGVSQNTHSQSCNSQKRSGYIAKESVGTLRSFAISSSPAYNRLHLGPLWVNTAINTASVVLCQNTTDTDRVLRSCHRNNTDNKCLYVHYYHIHCALHCAL